MNKLIPGKLYECITPMASVPPERGGPLLEGQVYMFVKEIPRKIINSEFVFITRGKTLTLILDSDFSPSYHFRLANKIENKIEKTI